MRQPWMKFHTSDWRGDTRLRRCSLEARGLWIEMIALMHEGEPYGHLSDNGGPVTDHELAVLVGAPPEQVLACLRELESRGVFSRTRDGVIYSRRLTRDAKRAANSRKNGKKGGNPTLSNERENSTWDNPPVNQEDKPQIPDTRYQKEDKKEKTNKKEKPDFEDWWSAYPRKVAKGAALKAYRAARKKTDAETLLEAVKRFAEQMAGKEAEFIPHAATWLNAERWLDEAAPKPKPPDPHAELRLIAPLWQRIFERHKKPYSPLPQQHDIENAFNLRLISLDCALENSVDRDRILERVCQHTDCSNPATESLRGVRYCGQHRFWAHQSVCAKANGLEVQ